MSLLYELFPKVRAELLRLLFADIQTEIYVRELERRSGLNVKTLQSEMDRLLKADLVLSRKDGNRRYFRANERHPLFVDLQQIVRKTAGLRDVLFNSLKDVAGIDVAFVFGSVASGKEKAGSDLDLLVIGDTTLRSLAPALRNAGAALGRELNPVLFTATEFRKQKRKNALLLDILPKPKLFVIGGAHELERLG
jgi:predicted nucleotidyltransferase/predicted transcriptional regulator